MSNKKYILLVGMPNSGKTTFNTVFLKNIIAEYNKTEIIKDVKLLSSFTFIVPENVEKNYMLLEHKEWIKDSENNNSNSIKLENKEISNELIIKEFSGNFLENLRFNRTYNSKIGEFNTCLKSGDTLAVFLMVDSKVLFEKKDYEEIDANYYTLFNYIYENKLEPDNSFFSRIKSFFFSSNNEIKTDEVPKIAIIANKLELFLNPVNEKQLEDRFRINYSKSYSALKKYDYEFFNVWPLGKVERDINGNIFPTTDYKPKNIYEPFIWLDKLEKNKNKELIELILGLLFDCYLRILIILLVFIICSILCYHCLASLLN